MGTVRWIVSVAYRSPLKLLLQLRSSRAVAADKEVSLQEKGLSRLKFAWGAAVASVADVVNVVADDGAADDVQRRSRCRWCSCSWGCAVVAGVRCDSGRSSTVVDVSEAAAVSVVLSSLTLNDFPQAQDVRC